VRRTRFPERRSPAGRFPAWALLACTAAALLTHPARAESEGEKLLHRIAQGVSGLATFQAEFVQTQRWIGMDASPSYKGTLYLKRPNLFRMEFEEPRGHVQVSDGRTVWTYIPENHEVLTARMDSVNASKGGDLLRWILETGRADPDVAEELLDGKPAMVVALLPPAGADLSRVRLWVRPDSADLLQYEFTDTSGNLTTYRLTRVRKNPPLADALFHFVPPAGVPVVELGRP
jgi:outer membrane lipoprotein carrier protein